MQFCYLSLFLPLPFSLSSSREWLLNQIIINYYVGVVLPLVVVVALSSIFLAALFSTSSPSNRIIIIDCGGVVRLSLSLAAPRTLSWPNPSKSFSVFSLSTRR